MSPGPVILIHGQRYENARVKPQEIASIIAHRSFHDHREEYLVRWKFKGDSRYAPHSWHSVHELAGADGLENKSTDSCLRHVQIYLDGLQQSENQQTLSLTDINAKRKASPVEYPPRLSPFDRSRASSTSTASDMSYDAKDDWNTYNCNLTIQDGYIKMVPTTRLSIDTSDFPTESMRQRSRNSRYNSAASKIRSQFVRGLHSILGKPVKFVNSRDTSTPSLGFTFIDDYLYREGVVRPDPSSAQGCGLEVRKGKQTCRPNMGGDCGCEYTRSCECLDYALVDKERLKPEERDLWDGKEQDLQDDNALGMPKWFPYSKERGLLRTIYLQQRWPIYECNQNCNCGPNCKSRVVQHGRTVGLEIFRTKNRGWGVRATESLPRGKFIDTYRGEVITREEADRRAEASVKGKDSYLFALDKWLPDNTHLFEIDGEFYGGPTRFINHSCDPNCVVYVVSKDKNPLMYEIAFFAFRDIRAGEELTFNYRDNEGGIDEEEREDIDQDVEADSIPCLCGAQNCRRWLWK